MDWKWRTGLDYSAANEYVKTHCPEIEYGPERRSYFSQDRTEEPVYDARHGVYDNARGERVPASIARNGFCLAKAPTAVQPERWGNMAHGCEVYLPELRDVVPAAFPGQRIKHLVFWHPNLRAQGQTASLPSRVEVLGARPMPATSIAGKAHIDTDLHGMCGGDAATLVSLVEKNRVEEPSLSNTPFPRRAIMEAIKGGQRFAIVNAWRGADPQGRPVNRAPLAMLATRYASGRPSGTPDPGTVGRFPEAAPDPDQSRWYAYSQMQSGECLLFAQYDRCLRAPSDVWHCALPGVVEDAVSPPRCSFEVRCFVVFEAPVPPVLDRFTPPTSQCQPALSRAESDDFCHAQSLKHKGE